MEGYRVDPHEKRQINVSLRLTPELIMLTTATLENGLTILFLLIINVTHFREKTEFIYKPIIIIPHFQVWQASTKPAG